MPDIQLFLAHADDQQPVLTDGLSGDRITAPDLSDSARRRVANLDGPPDDLSAQRWALVAPAGPLGDRLLEIMAPLRKKREEEQGREAIVLRVEPDMDGIATMRWMQGAYREAVVHDEANRPRYLAILGGPEHISWDFQQMVATEAYVGRISFARENHYEAYTDKLLRVYNKPLTNRAKALFHAVLDGSRATHEGHKHLVKPILDWALEAQKNQTLDVDDIRDVPMSPLGFALDPTTAAGSLLKESARSQASLLFTMSHGAGVPKEGWKSVEEQREIQGAMVLGRKGDLLTSSDVADSLFLPGGVWFMFACYGAGTPAQSAYLPWLQQLHGLGFLGKSALNVLDALPRAGERPFVSALPRAALANPDGPLGVIGHVDLAWSWGFLHYELGKTGLVAQNRAHRFQNVLKALASGHRFGVAHHSLVEYFKSVNGELTTMYDAFARQSTEAADLVEDRASLVRRANLWMQRQDLSAYVLLGDPAARLPITNGQPLIGAQPLAVGSSLVKEDAVQTRVDAVVAILRGTTSISATAKRMGISRDEVEGWVAIFIEGGRAALMKKWTG